MSSSDIRVWTPETLAGSGLEKICRIQLTHNWMLTADAASTSAEDTAGYKLLRQEAPESDRGPWQVSQRALGGFCTPQPKDDCFLPQGLEPGQEGNTNSAPQGKLTWLLGSTEPGPGITYRLYKHACRGDSFGVRLLPAQSLQTVCFPRPLWPINIADTL